MNADEFRKHGRQMVDYIADYMENIRERNVVHNVSPGYLKELLPEEAPENPEDFEEVFQDIEKVIMPGVSSLLSTKRRKKIWPKVIKLFSCSTQLSMKFFLLINVKMPTIVGILTFMSGKNSILGLSEPKKAEFLDIFILMSI